MSRRLRCVETGLVLISIEALGLIGGAFAQVDLSVKPELSAEERAQRQADKVFTFIKLQSVKTPAKRAPADAAPASPLVPATGPVQAKAAPKPAVKAAGPGSPATDSRQPILASSAAPSSPADAQRSVDTESAATLLAAANLSATTVRPELLPPAPAPQAQPEPPALQLLHKVEPEIPRQLQADFGGGKVMLRFMVQPDGAVSQAQALQSSHKRLSAAAIAAVRQWRFAPIPESREATVEMAFSME